MKFNVKMIENYFSLLIFVLLISGFGFASDTGSNKTNLKNTNSTGNINKREADEDYEDYEDDYDYLQTSNIKNITMESGSKLKITLKVDAKPNNNLQYDWYFNNILYVKANKVVIDDPRVEFVNKTTLSKLKINGVTTTDEGVYKCEVSNGLQRNERTTYVRIKFKKAPHYDLNIPKGTCEVYTGSACDQYLKERKVFIDPDMNQEQIEKLVIQSLTVLGNKANKVSQKCKEQAYPAICYFMFPPCRQADDIEYLCREDCEATKFDLCGKELESTSVNAELKELFRSVDCSFLKSTKCTSLDLPISPTCFNKTGSNYIGRVSRTISGKSCLPWPSFLTKNDDRFIQNSRLLGQHNFCRNPDDSLDQPWCFINKGYTIKEKCKMDLCVEPKSDTKNLAPIIIPSICVPFIIGCIVFAVCFCRKNTAKRTKGLNSNGDMKELKSLTHEKHMTIDGSHINNSNSTSVSFKKFQRVPELNTNSVLLIDEIGEGQFGKVYRANIMPNNLFCTNLNVAVKTLADISLSTQEDEFQREINVFSELQHENIACLKAIVLQPSLRCMIFEYSSMGDLHEFVVLRSPQSDVIQPHLSNHGGSQASSLIEPGDFITMAKQIASGMEYLSSRNFVHRDLAARNVFVSVNNQMKISNLAIVRDSYLSCYYRSPQGGQMLPIRWMAPESLQSWQFSDKSAVWSFGVLLWEMFSYGMQPYCGYSNHEVLEMISRRQLLDCPDQCSAKVYSLMMECWCEHPVQRPSFKELLVKLQGWEQQSSARMTSQIAQGIMTSQLNRHMNFSPQPLTNKFNNFQQTSNYGQQHFNHPQQNFQQNTPQMLNSSYNNQFVSPGLPPSYNQQQNYKQGPPSTHSSSATSSSSRGRNNFQALRQNNGFGGTNGGFQYQPPLHSNQGMHQRTMLSDVKELEVDNTIGGESEALIPKKTVLQTKPAINPKPVKQDGEKYGGSDVSWASAKATSCDSGVPPDCDVLSAQGSRMTSQSTN